MKNLEKKQISRRDFLKTAAVGAVGVASVGLLSACGSGTGAATPAPTQAPEPSGIAWDREADVVIVGSGGTGVSAAYEAAKAGVDTLILEK
ncbi:MAG TPA: 3-oxosteroid 1-dehydrogenase, partial [Clostridiales bacterium]|nr:3-oxosteroid 1-dehydrogenase [Clostridiales bacterium]